MLLFRAFHAQRNLLSPYVKRLGLGNGQPKILSYLAVKGPSTQRDLAEFYEIDAAARDSILGSLELLDRSLGALDATSAMRSASRTMKDTADQEWDKLEEETRFLSIDPSAKKRSFTSEKNQEPDTLQIILRTEEISLDDTKELLDAETEKEEMSPLSRMWNVLVKIWNAIVEIFKER